MHAPDADGTLRFVTASRVSPELLPFLHRDVTTTIALDRDGRVVRFP